MSSRLVRGTHAFLLAAAVQGRSIQIALRRVMRRSPVVKPASGFIHAVDVGKIERAGGDELPSTRLSGTPHKRFSNRRAHSPTRTVYRHRAIQDRIHIHPRV